ncbi:MAG: hypothetical protein QM790_05120 [Nibricoccus sp.]
MPLTFDELNRRYAAIPALPKNDARVEALCVRPDLGAREIREEIDFDPVHGAIGDRWERKTWMYLPDGKPDPRVQIAICNAQVIAMLQELTETNHHPGDTLFTNLDLSHANLPRGSKLQVGNAIIEISDVENDACMKFAKHHGSVVLDWIRLPQNRPLRLRGAFAKVSVGGKVRIGDVIKRIDI